MKMMMLLPGSSVLCSRLANVLRPGQVNQVELSDPQYLRNKDNWGESREEPGLPPPPWSIHMVYGIASSTKNYDTISIRR